MTGSGTTTRQAAINTAVGELDRWLDTMRGPHGYTGPTADWWRQRFTWAGTALDWRYEGIISGYVQLWRATGDGSWLAKAQWAGDDLLTGQSPGGHFERDPSTAGLAHEAMCANALLELALALRESHSNLWQAYATAGELTVHGSLIGELWDDDRAIFRDSPGAIPFLPHRTAAICEALFRQAELGRGTNPVEQFAIPALRSLVSCQVRRMNDPLDGAIPYRMADPQQPPKFLPICVARCIPALLQGYDATGDAQFFEAAWRAFAFVQRFRNDDGSFPAVVYANGRSNQYPRWIAATGDVLRAGDILRRRGISTDSEATLEWLLAGQDSSGGIISAHGFGAQVRQRSTTVPDVRDVLHVVGWCDKAFRALALEATDVTPLDRTLESEQRCAFRGRTLTICEDDTIVEIRRGRDVRYHWRKGDDWPTICAPEFLLT